MPCAIAPSTTAIARGSKGEGSSWLGGGGEDHRPCCTPEADLGTLLSTLCLISETDKPPGSQILSKLLSCPSSVSSESNKLPEPL